jgi:hypothetical protein
LLVAAPLFVGGGWVYDDLQMVGNAAMDDAGDVLAVFARTSADYLGGAHEGGSETRTWRPITMLTLVATHVVAPSPAAHHLVGWSLHVAAVALLLGADRRRATWLSLAVGTFALHPALAEAWLYVNGRSDLVAGLCLVGLWRACRMPGRGGLALVLLLSVAGALAKETFLCAAPFVLLARSRVRGRRSRTLLGLGALGLLTAIALAVFVRDEVGAGGSAARLFDPRMLARWPALVGLGAETLALPLPRPMRSLSHELGPAAPLHLLALVVPIGAIALLARARKVRPILHVLGAIAALLPTVLVSDVFWLGFDRYLYMPAVLLVTACASELRALALSRRAALATLALVALLGLSTTLSGLAYRDQPSFQAALLEARPDDPAGHLMLAQARGQVGDRAGALAALAGMPLDQLTGATAHQAASILHRLGRPDLVVAVLEDAHRREPDHPFLTIDMIQLRGAEARFDEALTLAARLRGKAGFCELARAEMQRWEGVAAVPAAAQARAAAMRAPCR